MKNTQLLLWLFEIATTANRCCTCTQSGLLQAQLWLFEKTLLLKRLLCLIYNCDAAYTIFFSRAQDPQDRSQRQSALCGGEMTGQWAERIARAHPEGETHLPGTHGEILPPDVGALSAHPGNPDDLPLHAKGTFFWSFSLKVLILWSESLDSGALVWTDDKVTDSKQFSLSWVGAGQHLSAYYASACMYLSNFTLQPSYVLTHSV